MFSEGERDAKQEGLCDWGGPLRDVLHVLGRQVRQGGPQGARGDLLREAEQLGWPVELLLEDGD